MKIDPILEIQAAANGSWEHMAERLWTWDDDYKTKVGTPATYALAGEHGEDARTRYPLREKLTRNFLRALAEQLEDEGQYERAMDSLPPVGDPDNPCTPDGGPHEE